MPSPSINDIVEILNKKEQDIRERYEKIKSIDNLKYEFDYIRYFDAWNELEIMIEGYMSEIYKSFVNFIQDYKFTLKCNIFKRSSHDYFFISNLNIKRYYINKFKKDITPICLYQNTINEHIAIFSQNYVKIMNIINKRKTEIINSIS